MRFLQTEKDRLLQIDGEMMVLRRQNNQLILTLNHTTGDNLTKVENDLFANYNRTRALSQEEADIIDTASKR